MAKCARRFFHLYLNETKKKSTVNSYNLISNHFHAKLKGKQFRNEAKFKFIPKRKNKLTNGEKSPRRKSALGILHSDFQ